MEGIFFYWLTWSFWIITTFFLNKRNPYRFGLSFSLLCLICLSPYTINVYGINVSCSSLFTLTITYLYVAIFQVKKVISFIVGTGILMLAYFSFLLFEIYDPIWVIFKREWLLAGLFTLLVMTLQKQLKIRVMMIIQAYIQGDILFAGLLQTYSMPYAAGSAALMDVIMITSGSLLAVAGLHRFIEKTGKLINSLEKGKHKTI
ncbi:hypothetical protein J9303_06580 [Bacillaceae bacterium Marseille-Q3522]|nr:hypothetical protein [Bacillaceae bacterium Marseille-Q3522]